MNDQSIEEMLNQKMEEVAREMSQPLEVRREESQVQVMDLDKLRAMGSRLLTSKIAERMQAISQYERSRTELLDSYRVRLEKLKMEADEQLREFDETHRVRLDAFEKIIGKLNMLREN